MDSEWRRLPISAVCELIVDCVNKTAPTVDYPTPYKMIRTSNIRNGRVDLSSIKYVTKETYDKWTRRATVEPKDVLLTREAPLGEVGMIREKDTLFLGQRIMQYRANSKLLDSHFLFYSFRSPELQNQFHAYSGSGSVVDHIRVPDCLKFFIPLPPLSEQRVIAHILCTLDDKIELNQQMNRKLEAITQAIFKSWFIDFDPVRAKMEGRQPVGMDDATAALFPDSFEESSLGEIPKGWEIVTLNDITQLVLGGDWGKDSPTEEDNIPAYCIRGADIPDLQSAGLGKMPIRYLKPSSIKKRNLLSGDIIVEISGGSPTQSTGRTVLITKELLERLSYPLVCSNFCRIVRLRETIQTSFIYLWLRWLYMSDIFIQYENGTTGIKNFAYTTFSQQHKLIIPPLNLFKHFDLVVSEFFKKRQANCVESYTLAAIRDTLLPKLMSGEIRVKEAEKILEDAA